MEGPDDEASSDGGGGNGGGSNSGGGTGGGSNSGGGTGNGGNGEGGNGGDNGGGGNGEGDRYSWGLPGGDLSLDSSVTVYNALLDGCADGRRELDTQERAKEDDPAGEAVTFWPSHRVALYRAAIATCEGDLAAARGYLAGAAITSANGDCTVYQRIVSVLEQRNPDDVDCLEPGPLGPTDEPPTDEPPTDEPPTDEPPTDEPPTDEPPTDEPPTGDPTTTTEGTGGGDDGA